MTTDAVERTFLTELEALEKFRISYTAQYPGARLSHDDPDVRRLIEALAFFTARTRVAAGRSLDDSIQRIFRQHFPALLGPTPAMSMLRADVGAQFSDVTELPAGTEVLLRKPPEENGAKAQVFRFRTLTGLRILPLRIHAVDMVPLRAGGYRILIRIVANSAHNQPLRDLLLHINHLDDLRSSMTVVHELRAHLRAASVVYEAQPRDNAPGQPCEVRFGAPHDEAAIPDSFENPLQQARMRMRFPQWDLFMHVTGLRPPRNWQHVTLQLDVADTWPRQLRLTSDGFELHTVPIVNVQREIANPIECDGTKDRYAVRHPDEAGRYAPLWAIAAYRPTDNGFVPLAPGVVGVEGDSYEVTTDGEGAERRAWATFNIPGAFEKPELLSVEAYWHQPGLRGLLPGDLKVGLQNHFVDGVTWQLSGALVPYAESSLEGDREGQLQLVSLKTQQFLGRAELLALLRACGAHLEPHFVKFVSALSDVTISSKPFGKRSHGLKYVYDLTFGMLDPSDIPRLSQFCAWLLDLLSTWSAEEVLEVVATVPNLDRVLHHV
jgi:type VI secretion system protein ImpG